MGDLHRVVLRVEHHVLLPHQVGGLPVLLTDIVSSQVDPDPLGGPPALVHQAVRRRDDVSALSSYTHCCANNGCLIMKMLAGDLLTLDLDPSRHNAALPRCDPPPPSTPGMHIQCIFRSARTSCTTFSPSPPSPTSVSSPPNRICMGVQGQGSRFNLADLSSS